MYKTMTSKSKIFFISCLILLSFSCFTHLNIFNSQEVSAKISSTANPEILKVNVQVSNSDSTNLIGSIHVISDITGTSMNENGITFPAGQTLIKTFEFNQTEIPIGTGFSVEVVYGEDYSKRVYGVNDPVKQINFFSINIP